MEDIHASQTIFSGEFLNAGQYVRKPLAGNGAIHAVIIRRHAAGRRKRRFAPGPESQPLRLVLRSLYLGRAAPVHDLIDSLDLLRHFFRCAVGFA